jgi:hypothetical protein
MGLTGLSMTCGGSRARSAARGGSASCRIGAVIRRRGEGGWRGPRPRARAYWRGSWGTRTAMHPKNGCRFAASDNMSVTGYHALFSIAPIADKRSRAGSGFWNTARASRRCASFRALASARPVTMSTGVATALARSRDRICRPLSPGRFRSRTLIVRDDDELRAEQVEQLGAAPTFQTMVRGHENRSAYQVVPEGRQNQEPPPCRCAARDWCEDADAGSEVRPSLACPFRPTPGPG